jgi:hypothetical protein
MSRLKCSCQTRLSEPVPCMSLLPQVHTLNASPHPQCIVRSLLPMSQQQQQHQRACALARTSVHHMSAVCFGQCSRLLPCSRRLCPNGGSVPLYLTLIALMSVGLCMTAVVYGTTATASTRTQSCPLFVMRTVQVGPPTTCAAKMNRWKKVGWGSLKRPDVFYRSRRVATDAG